MDMRVAGACQEDKSSEQAETTKKGLGSYVWRKNKKAGKLKLSAQERMHY